MIYLKDRCNNADGEEAQEILDLPRNPTIIRKTPFSSEKAELRTLVEVKQFCIPLQSIFNLLNITLNIPHFVSNVSYIEIIYYQNFSPALVNFRQVL